MATQTSLLPVYHEPGQDPASKSSSSSGELNHMDVDLSSWTNLQDEAFLQELLSGQGVRIVIYQVINEKGESACTCTCLCAQLGLEASTRSTLN